MTRQEHIDWCKTRALQYLEPGRYFSLADALASLTSNLRKHPETENHSALEFGIIQATAGMLDTPERMRHFIEGIQ